jgi:copper chaperone CopZ
MNNGAFIVVFMAVIRNLNGGNMTKVLALAFAVALAGSAIASEEEAVQLKVYVDGMSCPTGCAPKVAKNLAALPGAKDVKLEDFDKGLFTMSLDAKTELKPAAFQKSLGEYKVKKIEATLTGTISIKEKELTLTTASGAKYAVSVSDGKACCVEDKAEAKKDAPKKEDAAECPLTAALRTKVAALAKDGKMVKVTGVASECCEVSLAISAIDEVKKPAN